MSNSTFKPVQETSFGLYVWQMPDGRWVGDSDGNFLNVASEQYDMKKMKILRDAVRHYGVEEGQAVFLPGRRRVTDEELEIQQQRLLDGLTPDEYDAPALLDELREQKQNG